MELREATQKDEVTLAMLVSTGNQDVALKFGLTAENCPRHAAFCTGAWIHSDLERGVRYFILEGGGKPVACVGYEKANPDLAYLIRLAVLPVYRRRGIGERLVQHILHLARAEGIGTVSIGVIGDHPHLMRWYEKIGFQPGEIKYFPHLPFSVLYMFFDVGAQG